MASAAASHRALSAVGTPVACSVSSLRNFLHVFFDIPGGDEVGCHARVGGQLDVGRIGLRGHEDFGVSFETQIPRPCVHRDPSRRRDTLNVKEAQGGINVGLVDFERDLVPRGRDKPRITGTGSCLKHRDRADAKEGRRFIHDGFGLLVQQAILECAPERLGRHGEFEKGC